MGEKQHNHDQIAARFAEVVQCMDGCTRRTCQDGYVRVSMPNHPMAGQRGEVLEHRLVVEREIGRFLYPCEVVHHKNRVRSDNSPGNLSLCIDAAQHMSNHSLINSQHHVEMVRKGASDPNCRLSDLPISPATVQKICKHHRILWVSADERHISEEAAREALEGRTVFQAADMLGCNHNTLRRNFPHLISKRRGPNFLDHYKRDVLAVVSSQGTRAAADRYGTSIVTIHKALQRWNEGQEHKRKPPRFLDQHMVQACELLRKGVPLGKVAEKYQTSRTSLEVAILRWSEAGVLPTDVADRLNANKNRKCRLQGTPERGEATSM